MHVTCEIFVCQYFSSVAINTSIYQSSSAAVFILAVILLGESVTLVKVRHWTCCNFRTYESHHTLIDIAACLLKW